MTACLQYMEDNIRADNDQHKVVQPLLPSSLQPSSRTSQQTGGIESLFHSLLFLFLFLIQLFQETQQFTI